MDPSFQFPARPAATAQGTSQPVLALGGFNEAGTCKYCGRADKGKSCTRCGSSELNHPSEHELAAYRCHRLKCYFSSRKAHGPICDNRQLRRKFFRAVDILDTMWDALVTQCTGRIYTTVNRDTRDGRPHLVYTTHPREEIFEDKVLHPFDEMSFYGIMDYERRAIMNMKNCRQALGHMLSMTLALLSDCCENVDQDLSIFNFIAQHPALTIEGITPGARDDNHSASHSIFKVVIKTQPPEVYAVDLTRWQYGWTEKVMDWETYATQKVDRATQADSVQSCIKARQSIENDIGRATYAELLPQKCMMFASDKLNDFRRLTRLILRVSSNQRLFERALRYLHGAVSREVKKAIASWEQENVEAIRDAYRRLRVAAEVRRSQALEVRD